MTAYVIESLTELLVYAALIGLIALALEIWDIR